MVLNIVIYSKAPKETMGFRGFTHIWDHLGHVEFGRWMKMALNGLGNGKNDEKFTKNSKKV